MDGGALDAFRRALASNDLAAATDVLGASIQRGELGVRELRALVRNPPEGCPRWKVELVLRDSRLDVARRVALSPLWTSGVPERHVAEPEWTLRAWALAGELRNAVGRGELRCDAPLPEGSLRSIPLAESVWWWLTGQASERDPALGLVQDDATAAGLKGWELIDAAEASKRCAELESRAEALRTPPEEHACLMAFRAQFAVVSDALSSVREFVTPMRDPVPSEPPSWAAPDSPAKFGAWCAGAVALSIRAVVGDGAHGTSRSLARLVVDLEELVREPPLSLLRPVASTLFWRASSALLRAALDLDRVAEAARIADAIAMSGTWTRAVMHPLVRVLDLLAELGDASTSMRFLARFAWSTCLRRGYEWAKVCAEGPTRLLSTRPELVPTELRAWFLPTSSPTRHELDVLTEALDGGATSPRAFWSRAEARELVRKASRFPSSPMASVPRLLDVRARASTEGALSVHLEVLAGRHGERYFAPKVFAVVDGEIRLVAEETRYPVPIDRRRELDEARLALTRLRRSAEMGRASRAELRTLRAKLRSLFSAELLERLEGWSTNASVIEIAARERDLPWELLFSDETHARPTRRQRGVVAPRRALRRILLLADPGYDGALDELDLVEGARAWEAASRATTSGEACDALRDSWDVVHYAGHQGPADDGTPGLQLADGRLPIAALIDEGFVDPPSLLFLHACSTFSSTRVTDSEQGAYVDYGAFELLESSRIPCVIGTLWDVNPPPDRALVRAFYEGLDTHGGASVALASARASTASSGRWVTLSSAYVAYGDVRTREYHDG